MTSCIGYRLITEAVNVRVEGIYVCTFTTRIRQKRFLRVTPRKVKVKCGFSNALNALVQWKWKRLQLLSESVHAEFSAFSSVEFSSSSSEFQEIIGPATENVRRTAVGAEPITRHDELIAAGRAQTLTKRDAYLHIDSHSPAALVVYWSMKYVCLLHNGRLQYGTDCGMGDDTTSWDNLYVISDEINRLQDTTEPEMRE